MSTAISPSQTITLLPKSTATLKSDDNPPKLIRSSSIEKILKFNTYICSPQYYTLPAILTWLKSSKNGLHSSAEKTIFLFRTLVFGSILFKCALHWIRLAKVKCSHSTVFIAASFCAVVICLTVQMVACLYVLTQVVVPLGLVFLLVSFGWIVFLGYRINEFWLDKSKKD